jgi:hypothetical protein
MSRDNWPELAMIAALILIAWAVGGYDLWAWEVLPCAR